MNVLDAALRIAAEGHAVQPACYPLLNRPCSCDEATRSKYPAAHRYAPDGLHVEGSCCDGLCDAPGKHPLAEPSTDPEEIRRHFDGKPRNLMAPAGRTFDVLDIDATVPDAVKAEMPSRPQPTASTSPKRSHAWFEPQPNTQRPPQKLTFGEWWSTGQSVVLPPSLHPSGALYEWVTAPWEARPAVLTKALRKVLLREKFDPAKARKAADYDADQVLGDILGFLQNNGYPVVEVGDHDYSARCPAHAPMSDPEPHSSTSLGIRKTDDRVLLYCRAGCRYRDVVQALGVRFTAYDRERRMQDLPDEDVHPAGLLTDLAEVYRRYIFSQNDEYYTVLALWTLHCWVYQAFEYTPRLRLASGTKRSGKTRVFDVAGPLLPGDDIVPIVAPTAAAFFRSIGGQAYLLDEMDQWFDPRRDTDLAAMINAGFSRSGKVPRTEARIDDEGNTVHQVKDHPVFAPVAYAGIALRNIPDTLMDRSITLVMARRAGHERQVDRLRGRTHRLDCEPLRERLEEFARRWSDKVCAQADYQEFLIHAYADNDRARDIWEPLLLLATLAGDEWVGRCQQAAKFIEAEQPVEDTETAGLQLISQLHEILTDPKRRDSRVVHQFDGDWGITSTDLIPALLSIDEDYVEWGRGRRSIKERDVARLLAPFKVSARRRNVSRAEADADWRKGSKTPRRYMLNDVEEVYVRYFGPVDRRDDGCNPATNGAAGLPRDEQTPRSETHSADGRPADPVDQGAAPRAHTDVLDALPLPYARAVDEYGQAIVDEVLTSGEAIIDGDQLLPGEML